jgi:adenylate cyclase
MNERTVLRFLKELRRRRVFRTAGLYVVAAWLLLQVANIVLPAWGIPDAAIRYLILAVLLGFPVALVFGWIFEITAEGIRRTQPVASEADLLESLPLKRSDFLILTAFVAVLGLIAFDATGRVLRTTVEVAEPEHRPWLAELVENSVAVLPFDNLSPDPEQAFFADGISEEILNRLAAFQELKVIARTSSFAFKDSGFDIARISGLLGVEYLLQGSIRREAGRIRIAAQLIDHTGVQVWTETFDRELGGIFAL